MTKRWYIVHAYSNFEKKVAESIREQAAQRGLAEKFDEVMVPTEQVVEVRRGRKVNAERKFFPGYVLVKCDLTDDVYHLIKNTPKVTGFLGADNKPMPIPDREAERIKGQVAEGVEHPKPSDLLRDRRDGARGRRPVRILQRRRRGSRRGPLARQGRRVDLRPRDARWNWNSLRSRRSDVWKAPRASGDRSGASGAEQRGRRPGRQSGPASHHELQQLRAALAA